MNLKLLVAAFLLSACLTQAKPTTVEEDQSTSPVTDIDENVRTKRSDESLTKTSDTSQTAGSDLTTDATLDVEDVLDEKEAMDKTYSEEATKSEIAKRTVTPSENGDEKSGNDGDNIDDLKNEESSPVNELLVETNSGDIEGFKQEVLGKTVYTFLGIPYASPPIGESRFKLAKILKPWRRPYKAKYWPPHCAQTISPLVQLPNRKTTSQVSEDCLYLNIWTPSLNSSTLKPVLVWFHGGHFTFGSSSNEENDGKVLAAFGDVVVASFNYRQSVYGFLNLGTLDAPGNMALHDQRYALKWIHANIELFGGDSNLITLFGEGQGAFSIGTHIASPASNYLFKRAILQSGSPVHPRSILDEYSHIAEKFATAVGCNNENETLAADDPEEVLSCIKSQPTNTLKDATADVVAEYPLVSFMPSIGGLMFPVSAIESFAEPLDYYDEQKEIMIGVNKDEGSFFLHFAFPDRFRMSEAPAIKSKEETNLLLSEMVKSKLPLPEPIVNEAMRIFSDDATTNFTNNEEYVNYIRRIFGDNTIKCPVASFAKHFSGIQNKTVYFYQFEHRSAANKDADWVGVPTYEEVQFIFGLPLINQDEYSPADVELSKRMMNTWIHFAKTGEALPQLEKEWPKFELNDYEYMKIKADKAEIGADFGSQCLLFNHALNSGY